MENTSKHSFGSDSKPVFESNPILRDALTADYDGDLQDIEAVLKSIQNGTFLQGMTSLESKPAFTVGNPNTREPLNMNFEKSTTSGAQKPTVGVQGNADYALFIDIVRGMRDFKVDDMAAGTRKGIKPSVIDVMQCNILTDVLNQATSTQNRKGSMVCLSIPPNNEKWTSQENCEFKNNFDAAFNPIENRIRELAKSANLEFECVKNLGFIGEMKNRFTKDSLSFSIERNSHGGFIFPSNGKSPTSIDPASANISPGPAKEIGPSYGP